MNITRGLYNKGSKIGYLERLALQKLALQKLALQKLAL